MESYTVVGNSMILLAMTLEAFSATLVYYDYIFVYISISGSVFTEWRNFLFFFSGVSPKQKKKVERPEWKTVAYYY